MNAKTADKPEEQQVLLPEENGKEVAVTDKPSDMAIFMDSMERMATNPDVDPDKLEKFLNMKERILDKESESAYTVAMVAAQKAMTPIQKDLENTETRSKYASYTKLDEALRPVYTDHGFSLTFDTEKSGSDADIRILCNISHEAGHTKTIGVDMPADGKGPKGGAVMSRTHAAVSAMTYGRRTLAKMAFNLVEADDDGNAASGSPVIDEDRKAEIMALIKETETDTAEFCTFMGVESIDQISIRDVGRALNALKKKKSKNEAS